MTELTEKHIQLMLFINDECVMNGTCPFNKVAEKFGNDMVMTLMTEHSLISYDGKKPLGLKWTDLADEVFKPTIDPSWFAPEGTRPRGALNILGDMPIMLMRLPTCDERLSDIEAISEKELPDEVIPSQDEVDAVEIGQGVKVHANDEFFWVCIVDKKEESPNSGIFTFYGKVVDDKMEKYGIKKNEILRFCGAHICDIL